MKEGKSCHMKKEPSFILAKRTHLVFFVDCTMTLFLCVDKIMKFV
jgi:hypothetical protein